MTKLHDFHFFTLETIVIQTILLLLIIWVLNKFLFQPYLEYIDKEAEKRKKLEEEYKNIHKINQEAQAKKEEILQDAKKQAQIIQNQAEDLAKQEAVRIKNKATDEAQMMKNSAMNDIKKEKQNMLQDIQSQVVDLIMRLHVRIFDTQKPNRDFIEQEMKKIHKT